MNIKTFVGYILFSTASSLCVAKPAPSIKICYLPFQYETVVPVTPSSIIQEKCQVINKSDVLATRLINLVSKKPQTWTGRPDFNFLMVRLEIIDGNKPPIFVDQQGVVLVSNERYPLSPYTLTEVERLLNKRFGYAAE